MNPVQKKEAVTPAVTPAPVQPSTTPVAATPAPTKLELALLKLTVALREKRNVEVKPEMLRQDGSKVTVVIGNGWPTISIGRNGGFTVNELRSYADPFEAALQGDTLLARQTERDKKRVAEAPTATAPAAPVVATVVSHVEAEQPKKESTTQKKQKQHAATEAKLQASA